MSNTSKASKPTFSPVPPPGSNADAPGASLDPATAMAALGSAWRLAAVRWLADGRAMTASEFAEKFGRDFDGVSKHLRVLRAAGVVASRCHEEDARCECFYIPTAFRPEPGVVDYGFCLLRFPTKEEPAPSSPPTPAPAATMPGESIREQWTGLD